NAKLATKKQVPLCQDTGLTVVYIDIGQDVHFTGGDLWEAINAGVAKGYTEGYLRKSSVDDPIFLRKNTQDNTPAIIHCRIVPGEKVHIVVLPKGCGSENMSQMRMLKPADGLEGIINFVLEAVRTAGPNPCPPVTVGVGVGGNAEKATELAKFALARKIGEHNANPEYAKLEDDLLELVNKTGVGPAGLGGKTTALAVNVEYAPTHIGGMPCAVIFNCHAARRSEATI
ncbi:MAG: fumarate hydratase, partial [Acidaminococcaceae bacterium]|nr:fumarate hydratase [Acidaminococcaceae bacterium]